MNRPLEWRAATWPRPSGGSPARNGLSAIWSGGGADALSDARALLGLMRDFLGVCREHYHYHVAKREGRGDEAAFQRMLDLLNAAEVEPSPQEPNSK